MLISSRSKIGRESRGKPVRSPGGRISTSSYRPKIGTVQLHRAGMTTNRSGITPSRSRFCIMTSAWQMIPSNCNDNPPRSGDSCTAQRLAHNNDTTLYLGSRLESVLLNSRKEVVLSLAHMNPCPFRTREAELRENKVNLRGGDSCLKWDYSSVHILVLRKDPPLSCP